MRTARLALLIGAAIVCFGCPAPVRVTIRQARTHARVLDGAVVRIEGTLRRMQPEEFFVLEDEERNRIGIVGRVAPLLPTLEGRACRARGTLRRSKEIGLILQTASIEPIGPP